MASASESPPTTKPSQVNAFLFADVRGYTHFTLTHGDEAAARLVARFASLIKEVVSAREGRVVAQRGDEAIAVFLSTRQALRTAIALQERFAAEMEHDPSLPLRIGIGLDAGEAVVVGEDFLGTALNLAARLCALAGPGEILASDGVAHLAGRMDGLAYTERGTAELKGFSDPVQVLQIVPEAAAQAVSDVTPADTEGPAQRLPLGGFLGALPSGPLIGRDEELQHILGSLDVVEAGNGHLVLLAGEPGAGKTRLAQEATLAARNRGFVIAAGRCYEPEQTVPYYPFLDALTTLYHLASPVIRKGAAQRWPYLGVLLPDQIGVLDVAAGTPDEQQRVFRAVTAFLETLASSNPIALLLDDLHWADGASRRLLLHLARHTRTSSILLLGTYRDVEVGRQHPLEEALRDLAREDLVDRIAVRRLGEDATRALIGETMGQEEEVSIEFAHLVYSRTDGNPFFVQQVLRVLVESGAVFREGGRWERRALEELSVPESVRSVIGQRLSHVSEETQTALQDASVLGQTFFFEDLLSIADRDEQALETALDEAARAGLVRVTARDAYAFDHALTQSALYTELSPRRRRRLHLAAGEAIEKLPSREREKRVAELAWHFQQADDERALPYSILAGNAAEAVFGHSEAEWQYRGALALARERDDRAPEAEALEKLGIVLDRLGRFDDALAALERAATLYAQLGDTAGELRSIAEIGRNHALRGSAEEGISRLEAVTAREVHAVPSSGLAALHEALSLLYWVSGRYHDMSEAATRAAQMARAVGDERVLAAAELRRASVVGLEQGPVAGIAALQGALELAEQVGDLSLMTTATNNLAWDYYRAGSFQENLEYRRKALELAERAADPTVIAFQTTMVAQAYSFLGQMAEARSFAERSLEMILPFGQVHRAAYPRAQLAEILSIQGDLERANNLLTEAEVIAHRNGDLQVLTWAAEMRARFAAFLGITDEVVTAVEAHLEACRLQNSYVGWTLVSLGTLELLRGNVDRAEASVREALAEGDESGEYWVRAAGRLLLGMVLAERGRWNEAAEVFQETSSLAATAPYPYLAARTFHEWGGMLARQGKTKEAKGRLQEGRAVYETLDARLYLKQINADLSALG